MMYFLGMNYQQSVDGSQPIGPQNTDDFLTNASQADFTGMLDNIIDGVNVVGDVVNAPFRWIDDTWKQLNAASRGRSLRDIAQRGDTGGTWIARLTSYDNGLFDGARFHLDKMREQALAQALQNCRVCSMTGLHRNPKSYRF